MRQKKGARRNSLIPARPSQHKDSDAADQPAGQDDEEDSAPPLDAETQVSLPAFDEKGAPISDVPPPPIQIIGADALGEQGSDESDEEEDEPAADDAPAVDGEGAAPTVSVDGAYEIPPESVSSFVEVIGEEEEAEEYRSRGERPMSEPPHSGVEDFLQEGYFDAVAKHVGATDHEPNSVAAMFDDMAPASQAWWDGGDGAVGAGEAAREVINPPKEEPDIAELKKDLDVDELLRASLRPPADEDHDEDDEVEIPRPAGLPKGVSAEPVSRSTGPSRAQRSGPPAEDERPPSRMLLYAAGIIVAAGVGWYLARGDGKDAAQTGTTVVTHTVVVERTVAVGNTDDDGPDEETDPSTDGEGEPDAGTGQLAAGGPWAGSGAANAYPYPAGTGTATTTEATSAPTAEPSTEPSAEPSAKPSAEPAAEAAPFNRDAARAALSSAAGAASGCPRPDGSGSRSVTVNVTFAPSGRVTTAMVAGGPYAGTPTGSCIAAAFKGAQVPPFEGSFVTVSKTVRLQ